MNNKKKLPPFWFYYFLLLPWGLISQQETNTKFTLSGYIEDAESGEKLIGANVFDVDTYEGVITNNFGFFSLTLPSGTKKINVSYIGYETQVVDINLTSDVSRNFALALEATRFTEVEIIADRQKNVAKETLMSTIEVPIAQIKKVPALLGETDVLKALQLLPGVQSGGEGQSGLYVRGGSPDQNLILLDGVPVYNVSHLFGFFSVFNADAIKDVKLIKGGYPSRYGGRLSSVLEINMKEGNNKSFKGSGSIGLIASKLTLEGPLGSENTSFIVSGRRTYIDILAKPLVKKSFDENDMEGGTGYYFYDLNAKINHKISEKDRLYLSFYGGNDKFYFDSNEKSGIEKDFTENSLGWGNLTSALRWNHLWSPKLFSNTTLTFSNYDLHTRIKFGTEFSDDRPREEILLQYDSGIKDFAAKIDFDYIPNPNHFVRFGTSIIRHQFKPGVFTLRSVNLGTAIDTTLGQDVIYANELDAYLEDDFKIGDKLKLNLGVHYSGFAQNEKFYNSIQPRASARYLMGENQSLKLSFATMRQYINLLTSDGIGLPTDLWVPATDRIVPQDSWQIAGGYAFKLTEDLDMTIEGYYKKMKNLISFREGSGLFELTDWQDRITQGKGESYGAEFFLQKKRGRFTGWLGYTLSWTNRQFEELNFGEAYPYRFDRRHDISIVGQYEINDSWDFAATWVFGTGNAVTIANSTYQVTHESEWGVFNGDVENFASRNNYRMGNYHRMDLGFTYTKEKSKYNSIWSFGFYNTYNRKNPFFLRLSDNYEIDPVTGNSVRVKSLRQINLFPIIPYVTYSFEF